MRQTIIAIVALMIASRSFGSSRSLIIIALPNERSVAATITKSADFVSCPVSLASDKKKPDERFEDLQLAKARILKAAEQNPQIIIHCGPVSLSSRTRSSFSLSKLSSGYGSYSAVQLYILVPVGDQKPNIFSAGLAIKNFVSQVKMPDKTKCRLGQIQLAVDNPEQYRDPILKKISEHIKQAKSLLEPGGKVTVTGLSSPVVARQADDVNVEMFINYSLSLSTANR